MWPLQSQCDAFYGDPRGVNGQPSPTWMRSHLTRIAPPFQMTYAGKPIKTVTIHQKCADSLARVFAAIWQAAGEHQDIVDRWGVSIFGGSFNYRLMRGLNRLSMHSYGCAIDLDPARNGLGERDGHFTTCRPVLEAFAAEGAVWGGTWAGRPDPMHFQFARVG